MLCSADRHSTKFLYQYRSVTHGRRETYVMAHDVTGEDGEADVVDIEE